MDFERDQTQTPPDYNYIDEPIGDDPTFWNDAFNVAFSIFVFVIGFGMGSYVMSRMLGH